MGAASLKNGLKYRWTHHEKLQCETIVKTSMRTHPISLLFITVVRSSGSCQDRLLDESAFTANYSFFFFKVVKLVKKKPPYIFTTWQTERDVRMEKLGIGLTYSEEVT